MKYLLIALFMVCRFTVVYGQTYELALLSGPMLGFTEHRSVSIWAEVSQAVKSAKIRYWEFDNSEFFYEMDYPGELGKPYNPISFELVKLQAGTEYRYEIILNNKSAMLSPAAFRTREIWEHRKEAPDFSFVAGSCFYINDTPYDRPGSPYGQDSSLIGQMAATPADFNLWLGDNVYFRESDYSSKAGMQYRYSYDRRQPVYKYLLSGRPNYAIWDDHDYGPNNGDLSFEYKNIAAELFKQYWPNRSSGEAGTAGTYCRFSWSDCEFFLLDDRSYRSSNAWPDSTGKQPDCAKHYLGETQLLWLKNSLLSSRARFKFIVNGNQVLNPGNLYECYCHYTCELNSLIDFIQTNKINGVLFISGDRHFSEVIRIKKEGHYPLIDITSSAVTSRAFDLAKKPEPEFINPYRVPGTLVTVNNFAVFKISGTGEERVLEVDFVTKGGNKTGSFSIKSTELRYPKE